MKRKLEILRVVPDKEMERAILKDNEILFILEFSEKQVAVGSVFMLMSGCDLELMKLELLQVFYFGREIPKIPVGIRVVCKFGLMGNISMLNDFLSIDKDGYIIQSENMERVFILLLDN